MNDATGSGRQDGAEPDLGQLARDWITICRSELAALAADREAQETWRTLLALWAGAAESVLAAVPHGARDGRTGAADAPRAAAVAAAPDARDVEIARLAARLAELERRLDELERVGRGSGGARRKAAKRRD